METEPDNWRVVPLTIGSAAANMTLTARLVSHASSMEPTIWWHAADAPAVIVGPGRVAQIATEPGIDVVKRATGGGAVLAGPGLLGLDIALPAHHPWLCGDVVADYKWVGMLWVRTLARLGSAAQLVSIDAARVSTNDQTNIDLSLARLACFGTLSPYEVTVESRKVVGLAQVRRSGGVVISCAVHTSLPPSALTEWLSLPEEQRTILTKHLAMTAVSLDELLSRPLPADELIDAFQTTMAEDLDVTFQPSSWSEWDLSNADEMAKRPALR